MLTLRLLLRFFIDSKLFISLCALCIAMATCHILVIPSPISILFFIFSSTFLAYNIHIIFNIYRRKIDIIWLSIAAFLWVASIVFYVLDCPRKEVPYISLLLAAVMLVYYLPSKINFRSIPYLKSCTIAFAWSVATVWLPIAAVEDPLFTYDASLLFLERFLFVWSITIPFDIKDLQEDKQLGLVTLPMLYGLKKILIFAVVILCLHVLVTFVHYGWGRIFFVRVVTAWYVLVVLQGIGRHRPKYYYTGAIDGSMLLQPLLTLAVV